MLLYLYEAAPSYIRENFADVKNELVLITCDEKDCNNSDIPHPPWHQIAHAWNQIQSSLLEKQMAAWRMIKQTGHEILTGTRIYRDNRKNPSYFYLSVKGDLDEALKKLIMSLSFFRDWQYIKQGRVIFHSSAIVNQDKAFLFLGKSGSGKSTVCDLSDPEQYTVIHDDNVVVYMDTDGTYVVTDRSKPLMGAPIQALFYLAQDTSNFLTPIPPITAAKRLVDSSMQSTAEKVLHGQALEHTFALSASIARAIPAYELHFRKSPDFWDVIHAECGFEPLRR